MAKPTYCQDCGVETDNKKLCNKCNEAIPGEESNPYKRRGFKDRSGYLNYLAEQYDISIETVHAMAWVLGPSEDFDGLVSSLEDYEFLEGEK